MAIEARREVLRSLALGLGVVACRGAFGQPAERAAYIGIETAADSALSTASFFTASGVRLGHVPLDFRAHGMAEHGDRLVVFPRRPGDRFAVVDAGTLEIAQVVRAPADRHFFGHGAFTRDGAHLLVTENDLETLHGAIGVYEAGGSFRRAGEIALPGAGPHEIVRQPGRDVFHIALGGLETHPAYGRAPLNLHDFRSQIVTLDFANGDLVPLGYWPGSEGISLRHLAMDAQDRLYVGGQVKSAARATGEGVVWLAERGRVERLALPTPLGGYVSSVAASGRQALISSKETGAVLRLDGCEVIGVQRVNGAGALALGPGLAAVSGFTLLSVNGHEIVAMRGHEFDNHGLEAVR